VLLVFSVCVSANTQSGGNPPGWTRDPYQKFDRQIYLAAVGMGSSRQAAERDSLGKLAAIFGQSIYVDEKITTSYQEAVRNGAAVWAEGTSVDSTISTSAGMDLLVGAEIGGTWDNGREYYAAAVLNKAKAAAAYSGMIQANHEMINNLLNIPDAEKNTIDGYARYQFAAAIADITAGYVNVLSLIGNPGSAQGLKSGNNYRLEAQNIIKAIQIGINVKNDKSGRIEGAFARAFSALGFIRGGNNSRYVLEVDVIVSPVEFPRNPNKFVRMELSANLIDTVQGTALLPYNYLNNREGHTTQTEAENRIYTAAEQKIGEEYSNALNEYLSRLLPERNR
jgi:hypothetical protein